MNDAPVAELRKLDARSIAGLAEQLNRLLKLRTFPIGMKLFEDVEAVNAIPGPRRIRPACRGSRPDHLKD